MNKIIRNILLVFSAGCAGGFANSIVVWLFGIWGISSSLGVSISPTLSPEWLYPRIVWGGLWGGLFLLPLYRERIASRAFLFSLAPSAVQLFIVFPFKTHKGMMGLELGLFTPVLVLFFNFIWGVKTAILLRVSAKD